jgi:hypothetical protein
MLVTILLSSFHMSDFSAKDIHLFCLKIFDLKSEQKLSEIRTNLNKANFYNQILSSQFDISREKMM